MKNNIMIIVLVTLVALGVIITVIISSVLNNSEPSDPDSSESSVYIQSTDYISDNSSVVISSTFSDASSGSNSGHTVGDDIVAAARIILDRDEKVPFSENGETLEGFDNSGFIYYVLRQNGFLTCPRTLQAQTAMGRRLGFDELKPGDLVFFCNDDDLTKAGYGGIYTGSGTMIACLKPGTYVSETDISKSYYREHFFCGVSLS